MINFCAPTNPSAFQWMNYVMVKMVSVQFAIMPFELRGFLKKFCFSPQIVMTQVTRLIYATHIV